jgi:hypothetical protein
MSKTVLQNFRVDEDTRKAFHLWCIENETTMADHLRTCIDNTLSGKIELSKEKRPHKKKEAELKTWLSEWD